MIRFLQTASTKVVITRDQAVQEHGVASITCLLSGLGIFRSGDLGQHKVLCVAKGLYGFLVYAAEFWTEYLMSYEPSRVLGVEGSPEPFIRLACQLADVLENLDPEKSEQSTNGDLVDKRLAKLHKYGVLWKHVERALKARSVKSLEARILQTQGTPRNQVSAVHTDSFMQVRATKFGSIPNYCHSLIQSVICSLRIKKLSNH